MPGITNAVSGAAEASHWPVGRRLGGHAETGLARQQPHVRVHVGLDWELAEADGFFEGEKRPKGRTMGLTMELSAY